MPKLKVMWLVGCILLLQACALLSSIKISQQQLQEQINQQLPLKKRLLFAGLTIDKFEVTLLSGASNISIETDFALDLFHYPLAKSKAVVVGNLVFDQDKQALFLQKPVLRQLDVSAIPEQYQEKAFDALSKLLIKFFAKQPVYQFDKDKAAIGDVQVLPGYLLLHRS